jgi:hypothetical protein
MAIRVEWINKYPPQDAHWHICISAATNADGSRRTLTEEPAIEGIRAAKGDFCMHVGTHTVLVIIARAASERDYLKTEAGDYRPDNLLVLPECP